MAAFFRVVLVFFLSFSQIVLPGFQRILNGGQKAFFENWSPETEYTEEYATVLEKDPNKDFVVLNLTDIQLKNIEANEEAGSIAKATVDKLVNDTKPDLITLTGDNAWSLVSYIQTAELVDSYGIPWAPVMGNHDGQGCPSEYWCAKIFDNCENCLFKFGPKDMGYGNYVINITENGKVVHSLFMMDSHSNIEEDNINGKKSRDNYDHFWSNQLEWYEWAVKGIAEKAGHTVKSTVFMHIPVVEYKLAWDMVYDAEQGKIKDEYADIASGVNHEGVFCAPENNGFFALCKKLGSTENMICGHDHVNNFSILYDGIRLTYALKTGMGCYWEEELNGGTTVSVNSDGSAKVAHVYVNSSELPEAKMPPEIIK